MELGSSTGGIGEGIVLEEDGCADAGGYQATGARRVC